MHGGVEMYGPGHEVRFNGKWFPATCFAEHEKILCVVLYSEPATFNEIVSVNLYLPKDSPRIREVREETGDYVAPHGDGNRVKPTRRWYHGPFEYGYGMTEEEALEALDFIHKSKESVDITNEAEQVEKDNIEETSYRIKDDMDNYVQTPGGPEIEESTQNESRDCSKNLTKSEPATNERLSCLRTLDFDFPSESELEVQGLNDEDEIKKEKVKIKKVKKEKVIIKEVAKKAKGKKQVATPQPTVKRKKKMGGKLAAMAAMFDKKDERKSTIPICSKCEKKILPADERHAIGHKFYHLTCWRNIEKEKNAHKFKNKKGGVIKEIGKTNSEKFRMFNKEAENEKIINTCPKCEKRVHMNERGQFFKNAYWHKPCFTCFNCDKLLRNMDFSTKDNDAWCSVCYDKMFAQELLNVAKYEGEEIDPDQPRAVLDFIPRDLEFLKDIHKLINGYKVMFATMKIANHKEIFPFGWKIRGIDYECIPEKQFINFEILNEINLTRKAKLELTTNEIYEEFFEKLTENGACFGIILLTYKGDDFGRIHDSFTLVSWIPEDGTIIEKILYGSCKGKIGTYFSYNKNITLTKTEELTKEVLIQKLLKKN